VFFIEFHLELAVTVVLQSSMKNYQTSVYNTQWAIISGIPKFFVYNFHCKQQNFSSKLKTSNPAKVS